MDNLEEGAIKNLIRKVDKATGSNLQRHKLNKKAYKDWWGPKGVPAHARRSKIDTAFTRVKATQHPDQDQSYDEKHGIKNSWRPAYEKSKYMGMKESAELLSHIINKEFDSANASLNEAMEHIIEGKLQEMRQQIDLAEVSKEKLGRYINKAHYDGGMADFKHGKSAGSKRTTFTKFGDTNSGDKKLADRSLKREKGIHNAVKKLTGKAKVLAKEETIEEGRHKGIGNKKKKGRLAAQTADLRNTFGVAPGKRRRQGPRTTKLEEAIQSLRERFGKDTLKAIGTVTGITKDHTGNRESRGSRLKDTLGGVAMNAAGTGLLGAAHGPKWGAAGAAFGAGLHTALHIRDTRRAIKNRNIREGSIKDLVTKDQVNVFNEGKLKNWSIEFEEKFGRKPTNKDLEIKRKREIINHRIKTGNNFYKSDELDSEGKLRKESLVKEGNATAKEKEQYKALKDKNNDNTDTKGHFSDAYYSNIRNNNKLRRLSKMKEN